MVRIRSKLFICGQHTLSYRKQVIVFDLDKNDRWQDVSEMNIARRQSEICMVTDNNDTIWVIAGCRDCWPNGFIEEYRLSTGRWTMLYSVPYYGSVHRTYAYVTMCAYSEGFIYIILSNSERARAEKVFRVYNTKDGTWKTSETEVRVVVID